MVKVSFTPSLQETNTLPSLILYEGSPLPPIPIPHISSTFNASFIGLNSISSFLISLLSKLVYVKVRLTRIKRTINFSIPPYMNHSSKSSFFPPNHSQLTVEIFSSKTISMLEAFPTPKFWIIKETVALYGGEGSLSISKSRTWNSGLGGSLVKIKALRITIARVGMAIRILRFKLLFPFLRFVLGLKKFMELKSNIETLAWRS